MDFRILLVLLSTILSACGSFTAQNSKEIPAIPTSTSTEIAYESHANLSANTYVASSTPTAIPEKMGSAWECDYGEHGMQTAKYTINENADMGCIKSVLRAPAVQIKLPTRTMSMVAVINTKDIHIEYLLKGAFKVSCEYNGQISNTSSGWFNIATYEEPITINCTADKYKISVTVEVVIVE